MLNMIKLVFSNKGYTLIKTKYIFIVVENPDFYVLEEDLVLEFPDLKSCFPNV